MKFKYFSLIFFLLSCTNNSFEKSSVSTSKISNGFALIYNESDFENNIISSKLNPDKIEVAHNKQAVQIMTIHKSKGLEFPVVIFPYDLKVFDVSKEKVWC